VCGKASNSLSGAEKNRKVEGRSYPRRGGCSPEEIGRRKRLKGLNMSHDKMEISKDLENVSQNAQVVSHDEEKG
jgi:hypothetical protein